MSTSNITVTEKLGGFPIEDATASMFKKFMWRNNSGSETALYNERNAQPFVFQEQITSYPIPASPPTDFVVLSSSDVATAFGISVNELIPFKTTLNGSPAFVVSRSTLYPYIYKFSYCRLQSFIGNVDASFSGTTVTSQKNLLSLSIPFNFRDKAWAGTIYRTTQTGELSLGGNDVVLPTQVPYIFDNGFFNLYANDTSTLSANTINRDRAPAITCYVYTGGLGITGGGGGGVATVTAGTGITVTGTATSPIINNNGVVTLTAGTGITLTGTSNDPIISSSGGSGPLGFVVNGSISYQRDLVTFYDPDGPKTIRKWLSYTDPVTGQPMFAVQLATFSPTLSSSAQPSSVVNWDVVCTGFRVDIINPIDYTSEYISSVYAIAQAGGSVTTVLANYTAGSQSATPAGGVSWNQIFSTNGSAFIRPVSSTIAGGSASGTITFNSVVGSSPESPYATTASFSVTWVTPTNALSISTLSGQTFLTTYGSTTYFVSASGITTASNYAHVVTPTGGTINNSSGNGTFTFTTPIHKDNAGSRSHALATTFTRPLNVTGTSYSAILNKTASPAASFTYPSFYIFTVGTTTVPVRSDIISGSAFAVGVTVLGDAQHGIPTVEITNPNAYPSAFWFGLRTALAQPTVFQTGTSPALMNDVVYTNGGTVALQPDSPPSGYIAESYTLYGITLQTGKTYVRIS
jgi:hypothetical protein